MGAGEAEALAVAFDEAVEVDTFAADRAGGACAFVAGELAGRQRDADPGLAEEFGVREFAVGGHLLRVFFKLRMKRSGAVFGGLQCNDAESLVVVAFKMRIEVDEGRGHLAKVAEFEGAFADACRCHNANRVGRTAVDLDEDDEALAVGVQRAVGECARAWVVDAEAAQCEHGHAHAEDLASAEMTVGEFSVVEQCVE